jgi:hypothetical protein
MALRRRSAAKKSKAGTLPGIRITGRRGFEHPEVIDATILSRDGTTVSLAVAQDIKWSDDETTQRMIQRKLDTYLKHARSSEFRQLAARNGAKRWQISLTSNDDLDATSYETILEYRKRARRAGGDLVINFLDHPETWE